MVVAAVVAKKLLHEPWCRPASSQMACRSTRSTIRAPADTRLLGPGMREPQNRRAAANLGRVRRDLESYPEIGRNRPGRPPQLRSPISSGRLKVMAAPEPNLMPQGKRLLINFAFLECPDQPTRRRSR
jgi:hypothetical protein